MKIRMGYVTNSSSTNFLIISRDELTEDLLFDKLGFIKGGRLEKQGRALCSSIMLAINGGLRHQKYISPNYESIKKIFGIKSANIYDQRENYYVYWGYTNSDDVPITQLFTVDSFEVDDDAFYLNAKDCSW